MKRHDQMSWPLATALALLLAAGACRSTLDTDLPELAARPPLPYSVLLTGGAFVSAAGEDEPGAVLQRTFRGVGVVTGAGGASGGVNGVNGGADHPEAFPLAAIADVLVRGRVFVRIEQDRAGAAARRMLAQSAANAPLDAGLQQLLRDARAGGHDLLLVVEQLQDGPVEQQGLNGQWPITAITWILAGLGLVIPDHSYESRAALRVSLRDVQTGQLLYLTVLNAGPVNLSLVERTDALGLLQSVVVPPFWVGDDEEKVLANVRGITVQRLLVSLARQVKSVDVQERLKEQSVASVQMHRQAGGLLIQVDARESLSFVRLRLDGESLPDEVVRSFESELLGSAQARDGGVIRYQALYNGPRQGARLQVLLQSVAGRGTSVTLSLEDAQDDQ